jgi:hypothetical protein
LVDVLGLQVSDLIVRCILALAWMLVVESKSYGQMEDRLDALQVGGVKILKYIPLYNHYMSLGLELTSRICSIEELSKGLLVYIAGSPETGR